MKECPSNGSAIETTPLWRWEILKFLFAITYVDRVCIPSRWPEPQGFALARLVEGG